MMNRYASFSRALLLSALAVSLATAANAQATKASAGQRAAPRKTASTVKTVPDLEPRAIALLKATSARLAAVRSLSFTALEVFEQPSRHGHPLAYATRSDVTLRRPDGLRVIIAGDGPVSEFYYDGKAMMAFAPAENLLAVAEAPPTIDAALAAAYKSAGIYFPFTDLIVADPYNDMAEGLVLAYYVGQSRVVGGTTTDMVAYIDRDVFIQLWIGAEDKLPRMIRAVYLNDPERLRHELVFSNWQLEIEAPAESFTTAGAAGATRIPFAHPHPETASARRPATKGAAPAFHQ